MSDANERLKKIEEALEARLTRFDSRLSERLTQVDARLEKALGRRSTSPPASAEPPKIRPREEQSPQVDVLGKVDLNQSAHLYIIDDLMDNRVHHDLNHGSP